jgi:hypothetical protein
MTFSSYTFYRVTNYKPHGRSNPMAHKLIIFLNWRRRKKFSRNLKASLLNNSFHFPEEGNQSTYPCRENLKCQERDNLNVKSSQTRFLFQNVWLACIYCFRENIHSVSSQRKICHLILFSHFTFIKLYPFISRNFLNSNSQNNTRSTERPTESTKSNQNLNRLYLYYWHLVRTIHKFFQFS